MARRAANHPGGRLSPEVRLRCAHCDSGNTRIVETRGNSEHRRRRYKCGDCGAMFSTVEIAVKLRRGHGATDKQLAAQKRQAFLPELTLDELLGEIRRRAGEQMETPP